MGSRIAALLSGQYFSEDRGKRSKKVCVKVSVVDPDGMGYVLSDPFRIIFVGKILPKNQESVRFSNARYDIEARHSIPDVIEHVDQHDQIEALIGERTFLDWIVVEYDCSPGMLITEPSSGMLNVLRR